ASDSSRMRPRASATGAKKLTLNTWRHRSNGVSMAPKRPPVSSLGEMAALFTSASSRAPPSDGRVVGAKAPARLFLGGDGAVVHQRIDPAATQPVADLFDAAADIVRIGKVDLHMVLVAARPRAERGERPG